nr:hypothetical protein MarFTME_508 [Marseillevirus futianmevirus]
MFPKERKMEFNYAVQWSLGKEGKNIDLISFRYSDQISSGCFCCCRGDVSVALQKFKGLLRLAEHNSCSLFSEVSLGGNVVAKYQDGDILFHMEEETDETLSIFRLRIPSSVCVPTLQKLCKELESFA